jgi:hypothetical protein
MTKLRQVSEPIFAARNFMHRRQFDIIPYKDILIKLLAGHPLATKKSSSIQFYILKLDQLSEFFPVLVKLDDFMNITSEHSVVTVGLFYKASCFLEMKRKKDGKRTENCMNKYVPIFELG